MEVKPVVEKFKYKRNYSFWIGLVVGFIPYVVHKLGWLV